MATLWKWNSFILLLQTATVVVAYQRIAQTPFVIMSVIAVSFTIFLLAILTVTVRATLIILFRKEKPPITVLTDHLAITTLTIAATLGAATVLSQIEDSRIVTLAILLSCLIIVALAAFIKATNMPKKEKRGRFVLHFLSCFLVSLPLGVGTMAGLMAYAKQTIKKRKERGNERLSSSL